MKKKLANLFILSGLFLLINAQCITAAPQKQVHYLPIKEKTYWATYNGDKLDSEDYNTFTRKYDKLGRVIEGKNASKYVSYFDINNPYTDESTHSFSTKYTTTKSKNKEVYIEDNGSDDDYLKIETTHSKGKDVIKTYNGKGKHSYCTIETVKLNKKGVPVSSTITAKLNAGATLSGNKIYKNGVIRKCTLVTKSESGTRTDTEEYNKDGLLTTKITEDYSPEYDSTSLITSKSYYKNNELEKEETIYTEQTPSIITPFGFDSAKAIDTTTYHTSGYRKGYPIQQEYKALDPTTNEWVKKINYTYDYKPDKTGNNVKEKYMYDENKRLVSKNEYTYKKYVF